MGLSPELKQRIIDLAEHTSKSQRQIARDLEISHTAVQKTLSTWREMGSLDNPQIKKRGQKSKLSARTKKLIQRESVKDPRKVHVKSKKFVAL